MKRTAISILTLWALLGPCWAQEALSPGSRPLPGDVVRTNRANTLSQNLTITQVTETAVAIGGTAGTCTGATGNTINLALGTYFYCSVGGATTLSVTNIPPSGSVASFVLELSGGAAYAVTWPTSPATKWPAGTAPTLTAGIDLITCSIRDGATLRCVASELNSH